MAAIECSPEGLAAESRTNLADVLLRPALAAPDRMALYDSAQAKWLSYRELDAAARRIAHDMRAPKGLGFVLARSDLTTVLHYLGLLRAGHAVLLLPSTCAGQQLEELVERYEPEWILATDSSFSGPTTRRYVRAEVACPGGSLWRRTAVAEGTVCPELSLLLPTSGTTGSPKFVRLSTTNVVVNLRDIVAVLGITAVERAITNLPLSYSYGLSVLNSHLAAGASVVLADWNVLDRRFWSVVREQKVTTLSGVPHTYRALRTVDFDDLDGGCVSSMTQAGGRLEESVIEQFVSLMDRRGGRFFVMYGQTEAAPRMATICRTSERKKPGSVGMPMPTGRIEIVGPGPERPILAPGLVGEIRYTGPNVMMGYAEARSDLALGDMLGGTIHTGDLGFLDEGSFLFVTGREGRMAKVYGLRINLDDVERSVERLGDAAVIERSETLQVFIADLAECAAAELRGVLAEQLRLPKSALVVKGLPRIPRQDNGKINYSDLPAT